MVNPDPPRRTRDQGRKNQPRMNTDGRGWGIGCTAGTAFSTTNFANGANGDGRTKATTDLTDFGSVVARGVDPGGNILTGTRSCRLHSDRFWSPRRPRRGGGRPPAHRAGLQRKNASIRVHPCPFAVENARFSEKCRFQAENRDFHRKTAKKRTFLGSSGKFLSVNPKKRRVFRFARPAAPREWATQSSSERRCGRGRAAAVFGTGFRRALLEPL